MKESTMISRIFPILAVIGIVLFWGTSNISTKIILNTGISPMSVTFLRFLLASAILLPLLQKREPQTRIKPTDRIWFLLNGLFGGAIYYGLESVGLRMTSTSNVSMIMAFFPIFTVLADYLFCKNKISLLRGWGILMSVAGVFLVIRSSNKSLSSSQSITGNLLVLGACFSEVVFVMVSRKICQHYSSLAITTSQVVLGGLFMLPLALPAWKTWLAIDFSTWILILYLAAFCQAAAFVLYQYALARFGPVSVSSYSNFISIVGVLSGTIILGEKASLIQFVGGIVILAGVTIVNWKVGTNHESKRIRLKI